MPINDKKGKVNLNHAPQESVGGAHFPVHGLEPVGGEPLISMTRGQCDARLTVTFPAARHIGTYLLPAHWLVPNYTIIIVIS